MPFCTNCGFEQNEKVKFCSECGRPAAPGSSQNSQSILNSKISDKPFVERTAIDWYKHVVFENYSNFEGRASRTEYWNFVLVNVGFMILINVLSGLLFYSTHSVLFDSLIRLYALAIFIPALAVSIRRLHDIGKSGFWVLLVIIPVVGVLSLLFLHVLDSDKAINQYGSKQHF